MHVLIVGAGPAGLAAARAALDNGADTTILEKDTTPGGICKTICHNGLRYDLGPHRFFTRSSTVRRLWEQSLGDDFLRVPRLTRIFYDARFFDYPLGAIDALRGLGPLESVRCLLSYLAAVVKPHGEPRSFEDWISSQFGHQLYSIFFKTYTEKIWGIDCSEISGDWAAQRIRGLSLWRAVADAILPSGGSPKSLVRQFHYPRLGAGMMYDTWARTARARGARLLTAHQVTCVHHENGRIAAVTAVNADGEETELSADAVLSSMPLTELVRCLRPVPPDSVLRAADRLSYRSSVFVNLELCCPRPPFEDNWVYIHSPDIQMGRVTCFSNFSDAMSERQGIWPVTVEYFSTHGDGTWAAKDEALLQQATDELRITGLLREARVAGGFVHRRPQTYPVYRHGYKEHVSVIREYLSRFANLQPIGRCGMFKYNNMDHSILTGRLAAQNLFGREEDIWEVNTSREYHESGR